MKKILVSTILLGILLAGCMNTNIDTDKEFSAILIELTGAKTIKYNVSISETYHYGEVSGHFEDLAGERGIGYMIENAIIERSPLSACAISIISNQEEVDFYKISTGHMDKPFYKELYRVPIEDSDYNIDSLNNIMISQSFEELVRANIERYRETLEPGIHYEENNLYWTQPFDVTLESISDPFNILFYLIEQNSASFKLVDTDTGDITYVGEIDPDTIVDYYINDGSNAFEGLFYGYEGEMTRNALMNEMIANNDYSANIEPLNAILFTDKHIPVTISQNPTNHTYAITIIMTEAQKVLNEKRYAGLGLSIVVDEKIIEYTSMVLD